VHRNLQIRRSQLQQLWFQLKLIHPGDTVRETVNLDSKERDFFLHVPKSYDASKPTPLVLVFNGYSDKPGQGGAAAGGAGMEQITGLSQKSDDKNFLVAYMDGKFAAHLR
jgi:poly(3-hydroxybutyrate) depolymerase